MAKLRHARERVAAIWEERRARGLCGSCGLAPASEGKAQCRPCMDLRSGKYDPKPKRNRRLRRTRRAA